MVDTYGIEMVKERYGDWVQKSDYDSLAEEKEALEKRIEELEDTIEDLFERLENYE